MKEKDFFLHKNQYAISNNKEGEVFKRSSSNIALIKYWGKKTNTLQIPLNSSISFSLEKVFTGTKLRYHVKTPPYKKNFSVKFFFFGKKKFIFWKKILVFFYRISSYCSYLRDYHFTIETYNNFPHSSGIASSASFMSSLALCIMEMEKQLVPSLTHSFFLKKASFLARLGSGSACRSVYPGLVVWGNHKSIIGSNNLYAIPYPYKIHSIFQNLIDTILIIDETPKKILSTQGHQLMNTHPYAKERFKCANKNMDCMISILEMGDFQEFGKLIEHEALTLHAMIMTSNPYFLWMKPNTVQIIHMVWDLRIQSKKNVYFTLDAGANIHLLYPMNERLFIGKWIKHDLMFYCKKIIESICF
ncbi:diphosphomevalonate/mevalonate 3,5-bisphosphate decarboxylase family protein [Blattabacterium cuenoti]|uniref:diphosphomevalonate/mevalonate 3,5-bisphosphate decarboxylase family protein n=1 Tax=Blattabacterium cuenoti TaxID=1653831 RepID=UPI00163C2BA2